MAIQPGIYAGKWRKQGEIFRVGLLGEGPLPSWLREVQDNGSKR